MLDFKSRVWLLNLLLNSQGTEEGMKDKSKIENHVLYLQKIMFEIEDCKFCMVFDAYFDLEVLRWISVEFVQRYE